MNVFQGWRTRLLHGYEIDWGRRGTRMRCSGCSQSLMPCLFGPKYVLGVDVHLVMGFNNVLDPWCYPRIPDATD